ncbi:thioredoxin domain-containing protein 6 [Patagioenas fasciata]|uniref:thioredoxin domain-containing protein 6 n=1 Tax=Patagioenas fasciata TaxID=372321 RepID=UPI0032E87B8C
MAAKKKEVVLQININSQELWEEMLCLKGLIVVDVFQAWCGPCKTVVDLFRKLRNEVGSDLLHFAVAEVDSIDALEKYRGTCEPVFLFFAGGELVAVVRGVNAQLLQKTILEQLAVERKVLEHGGECMVVQDGAFSREEGHRAALQAEQGEG